MHASLQVEAEYEITDLYQNEGCGHQRLTRCWATVLDTIQLVLLTWETIHPDHHEGSSRDVLELELDASDIRAAASHDCLASSLGPSLGKEGTWEVGSSDEATIAP